MRNPSGPTADTASADSSLPPMFVISLKDSHRRPSMQARMDAAGLPFQWWDAIDGRGQNPASFEHYKISTAIACLGRPLGSGEIALFHTTLDIYRYCIEHQVARVVIFEDDAVPDERCATAIREVAARPWDGITQLHTHLNSTVVGTRWKGTGARRLAAFFSKGIRGRRPLIRTAWEGSCFEVRETTYGGQSAAAYMIDAASMRRILDATDIIWCAIDDWLRRTYAHKVRMQCVFPRCASIVGENDSSLDQDRETPIDARIAVHRWASAAFLVMYCVDAFRLRMYRVINVKYYT